jgi:hypothetical protein
MVCTVHNRLTERWSWTSRTGLGRVDSVLPCHCQLDVPFVHEQKDPAGTPGIETWNLSHDAGFHPMPEQWEVS